MTMAPYVNANSSPFCTGHIRRKAQHQPRAMRWHVNSREAKAVLQLSSAVLRSSATYHFARLTPGLFAEPLVRFRRCHRIKD